jgi:TPR repeat protein
MLSDKKAPLRNNAVTDLSEFADMCSPDEYCDPEKSMSIKELIKECTNNDSSACFRTGITKMKEDGRNYSEFLQYFKKSCDLKLPDGCSYYSENLKSYTELQKIQTLDLKCIDKKDRQSCLDLMMIFREKKMNAQAHPYAEKACYYGVQTGCEFMRAIEDSISMEAQRKSLDLQSSVLAERNRLLQEQISTERNNANAIASELSGINFRLNLLRTYGPK